MSTLQLRQIQGFILRMYRMPMVRHFLLQVNTPAAARVLLGRLASGDERDTPQITTAEEWHVAVPGPEDDLKSPPRRQTDYCLNVGVTWPGLVALELKDRLPGFSHGTFNAFVEGAAKRAEAWATEARVARSTGSVGSARAPIMCWSRSTPCTRKPWSV